MITYGIILVNVSSHPPSYSLQPFYFTRTGNSFFNLNSGITLIAYTGFTMLFLTQTLLFLKNLPFNLLYSLLISLFYFFSPLVIA